jgi:outer membrane protein assembly factor BamB
MNNMKYIIAVCVVILVAGRISYGDDWPQFRGPNRDGKSAETGLLKKWPDGGPKLLWSADGLGIGFSSVAVANGLIYTTGMLEREGFLFAFDLNGKLHRKVPYGQEWRGSFPGTRTTPTVDGDRVYVFSGLGALTCFNTKSGDKIWQVDTLKEFEGKNIIWGMSGSPLIDGNNVICTPGGSKGTIVALDKFTGRTIWATTGLTEAAGYCSPIIFKKGQNRLLVNMIQKSVICVRADSGAIVWQFPYEISYDTGIITPVYHDGCIFITSVCEGRFTRGAVMLSLSADGTSVSTKWTNQVLDCHHGGVVLVDGYLYGSNFDGIPSGDWVCLDWNTGQVMYEAKWNGNKGAIVYADGMLYCYDENTGDVALVKASPAGFQIISSFRIALGSGKHWAHPAISDGRLYIRHGDVLMAYDIKNN